MEVHAVSLAKEKRASAKDLASVLLHSSPDHIRFSPLSHYSPYYNNNNNSIIINNNIIS